MNPKTHARPGDEVAEAERRRGHRHLHQLPGGGGLRRRRIRVQCLPLYSLLAAMGQTTVHYLVLDIEGAELQVLEVSYLAYCGEEEGGGLRTYCMHKLSNCFSIFF